MMNNKVYYNQIFDNLDKDLYYLFKEVAVTCVEHKLPANAPEITQAINHISFIKTQPLMVDSLQNHSCYIYDGSDVILPSSIDEKFEEFRWNYAGKLTNEEEMRWSIARGFYFTIPFFNTFYDPDPKFSQVDEFIQKNSAKLKKTYKKIGKKCLSKGFGVPVYLKKESSASMYNIPNSGGLIYPKDVSKVQMLGGDKVLHESINLSDFKKTVFKTTFDNLEKDLNTKVDLKDTSTYADLAERGLLPYLHKAVRNNNKWKPKIVNGKFFMKNRVCCYAYGDKYLIGELDMMKLADKIAERFEKATKIKVSKLARILVRSRLVNALPTSFNSRFLPVARGMLHGMEHSKRHFINDQEDLVNDFKKEVEKFKKPMGVFCDQRQCDQWLSKHSNIFMSIFPDFPLLESLDSSFIARLSRDCSVIVKCMPSGVAWTTLINVMASILKLSMIFCLLIKAQLLIDTIISYMEEITDFLLCEKESLILDGCLFYIFLPTDDMNYVFDQDKFSIEQIRKVQEYFDDQIGIEFVITDRERTFGHDIDLKGKTIEISMLGVEENSLIFEKALILQLFSFKLISKGEKIFEAYCRANSEVYGVDYRRVYLFFKARNDEFIDMLIKTGADISQFINQYSASGILQIRYLKAAGVDTSSIDMDSIKEFQDIKTRVPQQYVDDTINYFIKNYA